MQSTATCEIDHPSSAKREVSYTLFSHRDPFYNPLAVTVTEQRIYQGRINAIVRPMGYKTPHVSRCTVTIDHQHIRCGRVRRLAYDCSCTDGRYKCIRAAASSDRTFFYLTQNIYGLRNSLYIELSIDLYLQCTLKLSLQHSLPWHLRRQRPQPRRPTISLTLPRFVALEEVYWQI